MLQQSHLQRNQPECRKHRLFRFFHSLLQLYSVHPNIYYLLLLLQTLQMVNYAMHASYPHLWTGTLTHFLQTVLAYTDLSYVWRHSAGTALLLFVAIGLVTNAIALILVIYETEKDANNLTQVNILAINFVTYHSLLMKTVLFLPLCLASVAFAFPSLYSLDTQSQIILAVISTLNLILTVLNTYLYILYVRDNSPFSKLPFASSTNYQEQIRQGIKFGLAIYGSFAQPTPTVSVIFCIVYAGSLFALIHHIHSKSGLINYPFNRIIELCPVISLWITLTAITQILFTPDDGLGIYLALLGTAVLPFAWAHLQTTKTTSILTSNYKSIHSASECLIYNYESIRLANHPRRHNLLLLEGILNFHIYHCRKSVDLCLCNRVRIEMSKFKLDQQHDEDEHERQLWFEFIKNNLNEVKQKYETTLQIRFLLAYLENEVLHNKFRALRNLEETAHDNHNYKLQFLTYHYLREIEKGMENYDRMQNEKRSVDINKYYHFDMDFGRLQLLMEESTYQHLAFWELLKSDKASKGKLFEEGVKINEKLDCIHTLYADLMELNSNNIHCLILFSNFMKVIVNSNQAYQQNKQTIETVKRSLAQAKLLFEIQKQKYGDNSVSAIVIISGERNNIGVIKYCNEKISHLLGYAPHQLLGQNINLLMPKFIGNMHDDVLKNYLEQPTSKYDYVERLVPMIDSRNFMVLARMMTKPLPSLLNGLEIVGIFNLLTESSANHPEEIPKYVLYRTDTGQVQALSEACHDEFHYKINAIDEYNETSSELSFNTLFAGVKQNQIAENPPNKCRILSQNDGYLEQTDIQIFERLTIVYYSVKLRLLSFYTLKSFRRAEQLIEMSLAAPPEDTIIANQKKWEKQPKTERTITISQDKAVKEKFLHQMSKKNTIVGTEPTSFKFLRYCGYVYFVMVAALSVLYIVLHTQTGTINDYLSLSVLSGETIGDICEIDYNARLMHLSHYYPAVLNEYTAYQNNISVSVTSLQNGQFNINKIYLNYGSYQNAYTLKWIINPNGAISSTSSIIDANVLDFVTSSSSFNQAAQAALAFSLVLKQTTNITQPFMDFFKIRQTGLYETLASKQTFQTYYFQVFSNLFTQQQAYANLELGLALGLLALILAVIVPLSLSVLNSIDQTILLFGYMNRSEIEKQIANCNSFLEIFYQDSYLVRLKKKKQSINQNEFNSEIPATLHQIIGDTQKFVKSLVNFDLDLKDPRPERRNIVKTNINKIQCLEKQLLLRTEAEIPLGQAEQENENQLLKMQQGDNGEDDNSIYEHLASDKDNHRVKIVLLYLAIIAILAGYFLLEYFVFKLSLNHIQTEIAHLQEGYSNINSLKLIKLYTLETLIDNSQFMNYSTLNATASRIYADLYTNQRNFDLIAQQENTTLFPYYYQNMCDPNVINSLTQIDNLKIFTANSYSAVECSSLLQGVLIEGLRFAIVGYAQKLYNFTQWTISALMNSPAFIQTRKMQKYIEPPLRHYVNAHQTYIQSIVYDRTIMLATFLIVFLFLILALFILVWRRNLERIYQRLRATRLILGFIPVRVFIKNAKLTKEYEKYIGDLME